MSHAADRCPGEVSWRPAAVRPCMCNPTTCCVQIFTRERLNGYYGVLPYTLANTAASLPFLAVIAITCMLLVSLLAGLDMHDGRFLFRVLNLLLVLMTVRLAHPAPVDASGWTADAYCTSRLDPPPAVA